MKGRFGWGSRGVFIASDAAEAEVKQGRGQTPPFFFFFTISVGSSEETRKKCKD